MARKFRGTETVKVDSKGRMSVPARMRKHFEQCDPAFATSNTGRAQLVSQGNTQGVQQVIIRTS